MSKQCPDCGYENADNEDFCSICGFELGGTDNFSTPSTDSNSVQSPIPQIENTVSLNQPIQQTESTSTTPEFTPPNPVPTSIQQQTPTTPTPSSIPEFTQPNPVPTSIPQPTNIPDSTAPSTQIPSSIPVPNSQYTSPGVVSATATARLIAKQPNAPVKEFPINGNVTIGVFTPESGPVDIDLEDFPGQDLISKQHGEIIYENGSWVVKDLGSTNGIYIKPVGQTRFSGRIMAPTPINSGDEINFAKVGFIFQTP